MPRTALTSTPLVDLRKLAGAQPSANQLDTVMTAADAVNFNEFTMPDAKAILVAHNSSATTAYTLTVYSTPDDNGRKLDVTAYTLQIADIVHILLLAHLYSVAGKVQVDCNNAAIRLGLIYSPLLG